MADSRIDPFDVAALEKSLNDSATRVSAIWVSFLIFSLYLLTAAATVTHRQLLLAEPVKLPVLNIDLPLWGFFFLAPILFVLFHAYVLIQLILLARTAAAYNEALDRHSLEAADNARVRQRLANTLFTQIFAGSPREREGWLGRLLKTMASITLLIAPILILLTFQFMFLPYHSHLATWMHRLLILLELAAALLLWPLVIDAQRDFQWPSAHRRLIKALIHFPKSIRANRPTWQGVRRRAIPLAAVVLVVFLSLSLASFPGEPHVNLFAGRGLGDVECTRWYHFGSERALEFDRLSLPQVDAVDDDKLAKITRAASERKLLASAGERTRDFRARDLTCANLVSADLRRVDLTGAKLTRAQLDDAALEGASLDHARLDRTSLPRAQLQEASLNGADLQRALLSNARLQGALLHGARLQGASLQWAQLEGASLKSAYLQGASLAVAKLQAASFESAQLQGAYLTSALAQGALFYRAHLQGASLTGARFQAASFREAHVQGADFRDADLDYSDWLDTRLWRARSGNCSRTWMLGLDHEPKWDKRLFVDMNEPIAATRDGVEGFIAHLLADVRADAKDGVSKRLRESLLVEPAKDDTATIAQLWRRCGDAIAPTLESYDDDRVAVLRGIACVDSRDGQVMARGLVRNLIFRSALPDKFNARLARALLGEDGQACATADQHDEEARSGLRSQIALFPQLSSRTDRFP